MIPLAAATLLPDPQPALNENESWRKVAEAYALLTEAVNMLGDMLQDINK
jgi:hypothetical protein